MGKCIYLSSRQLPVSGELLWKLCVYGESAPLADRDISTAKIAAEMFRFPGISKSKYWNVNYERLLFAYRYVLRRKLPTSRTPGSQDQTYGYFLQGNLTAVLRGH